MGSGAGMGAARIAGAVAPDAPVPPAAAMGADSRLARRSRIASTGLVLVLLAISVFTVTSAFARSSAANAAARASRLSEDYQGAARSVTSEESLERLYRLEPQLQTRRAFERAATDVVTAVGAIARDGDGADRATASAVLAAHHRFLRLVDGVFRATASDEPAEASRLDQQADVVFDVIEETVGTSATAHHLRSMGLVDELKSNDAIIAVATPIVFVLGLGIAAVLLSITRGYRRLLGAERGRARYESLHDPLTGLPNRSLLDSRFRQVLGKAGLTGKTCALLLIDLDRFREINDTLGHHYGDELLVQIGPRLRDALRDRDMVARLGGDEFGVLLAEVANEQAAMMVADRVRLALNAPFHIEGVELDVEASIGVAVSGRDGHDPSTLLQRADVALYVAKAQGIGVVAYDAAVDVHHPDRLRLLGELRRALANRELILHFQPKVSVDTGVVVGVEALLRWQHPERGLLFPDTFLPLAEHTGLIGPLTSYVLDAALGQGHVWARAGHPLPISVNLSSRNLLDEDLPQRVAQCLQLHQVSPELLELEVTESAIMTDPARAQRVLQTLAALGINLSIDDFGAGYTSLSQLKTLPISLLKIDKSFVLTMTSDASNALIVQTVVDLGHSLGLTIVAEGVEDEAALALLKGYGCDIAQGYHVSRPLPVKAFDSWYAARRAGNAGQRIPPARPASDPGAIIGSGG